jgi:hypothetical protein
MQVAFSFTRNGFFDLFRHLASGAGEDQILLKSREQKYPLDWSGDGRYLLYASQRASIAGATAPGARNDADLWVLPMQGPEARPANPFRS